MSRSGRYVLAVIATCVWLASASADSGGYVMMRYTKTKAAPIEIQCDDTWVAGDGYRPARIRIKPVGRKTFSMDRQITLEIRSPALHNNIFGDDTSQVVDLPQGAEQVELIMLFQQTRHANRAILQVWEGRRTLLNVTEMAIAARKSNSSYPTEATPNLLIVDSDLPNLVDRQAGFGRMRNKYKSGIPNPAELVRSVPNMYSNSNAVDDEFGSSWVDTAEAISTISFMHPADLPENWLGFSMIDIVFMDLEELAAIQNEHPAQWAAIDRWCRAGGMLWVAGLGDDGASIEQLETLLGIENGDDAQVANPWVRPGKANFGERVDEMGGNEQRWVKGRYISADSLGKPPKYDGEEIRMSYRDFQMGRVVAFDDDQPLQTAGDPWYWQWVLNSLEIDRWCWSKRHGFSMLRFNDGFWEHLIPDVGLAPVNSFRVIITLFALVVGPINYAWLSRRRRLNWMLFTVPAAAALVTVGLVSYAFLTDGVAAKSRIRSAMNLDQRVGKSSVWARQTYYAGVAPAGGIAFDDQTAVFAVDHDAGTRSHQGGQNRHLEWGDSQLLRSGFLPSRTTSQFLTIQSQDTTLQLQLDHDENGKLQSAKNLLGSEIIFLVLRDYDGQLYASHAIPNGESAQLKVANVADVGEKLREIKFADRRVLPAGVDLSLLSRSQNRMRWSGNTSLSDPSSDTSRLEQTLMPILSSMPTAGTYHAIVKDNVQLDCAVRSKSRNHEVHGILGHF